MKALVYVIVQSVIAGGEEHKNIHGVYTFKHQAQDRMNEIVVEFEDKQDAEGNFLWECERPWWSIANFKSNTHDFSKVFCEHLEAYHRYNMMCADCGAGVAVAGNLGYHFQVVENVSKNVIKKNLA